jgi:hypothetical protein
MAEYVSEARALDIIQRKPRTLRLFVEQKKVRSRPAPPAKPGRGKAFDRVYLLSDLQRLRKKAEGRYDRI